MTWQEFRPEMTNLMAAYPSFKPENKAELAKAYFAMLARFSLALVRRGIRDASHADPQFFPSAPTLVSLCEQAEDATLKGRRLVPKFQPEDHACGLSGAVRVTVGSALKLLYRICPYEAVHVRCAGAPHPICPLCGIAQPPFINPFIAYLIQSPLYKAETKGWNAHHKGLLLCPTCERSFAA